jgi:hypothetical protein
MRAITANANRKAATARRMLSVSVIVGMSGSSAALPHPSSERQRLGERPLINR